MYVCMFVLYLYRKLCAAVYVCSRQHSAKAGTVCHTIAGTGMCMHALYTDIHEYMYMCTYIYTCCVHILALPGLGMRLLFRLL